MACGAGARVTFRSGDLPPCCATVDQLSLPAYLLLRGALDLLDECRDVLDPACATFVSASWVTCLEELPESGG